MRSHNQSVTQERFLHLEQCDSLPFSVGFQCNFSLPKWWEEKRTELNEKCYLSVLSGSSFCSLITTLRLRSMKLVQSMRVFIK